MNEIGIGEQKKVTMAELLEKNVLYTVPIFQREYSWKKDELSDLYEDLERSLSSNSQHFFGFMMIKPDDKTYVNVIEGQQRLATVTIILCVIRDILFNMNDDLHRDIETKYIKTINIFRKDSPANYKVSLSKTNKSYFRELIQERNDPETKLEHIRTSKNIHPSNKLIQNAYKYFYTTISQKIQNFVERNKLKHLTKLLEMLLTNFVVITTEVYDSKTAYNVFQTLNDRGLDLALADLLKVYMFDLAGNDVKTAKDRWDEIVNILGNINMNNFLRHYWVSKFGIVSQKNLMNEFEKNINSKLDVFNFLDELKFEAEIYESIFNKSSEMWNKDIVILLDELFILTKNIVLPLLLGTLQTLEERYHKKFLSICISFIFRYLTIAERENKELESLFSKMSIDIRNGSLTTLGRIKERLLRIYVDDDTFEKIFMNKDIKTAKVARYILQKLESNLDPIQEKFSNRITLEHILPKNPNQEWIDYITSKKINTDKVVDKLGNMTLLLGKVNKIAQNKFFIEKRDLIYSKMTKLKINSDISKITSWTEAEVLERQSIFAKQAKKIWSI